LLQHPAKVNGVLRVGFKGTHPSDVVLQESLGLGMLDITFYACPPKGMFRSHQPIFPCNDCAFPVV
jgi:hypothetical protein